MGMAGITPEESKGRSFSTWGLFLRFSLQRAASQAGRTGGIPALGITSAFMEPHEELIRWRRRDERRH